MRVLYMTDPGPDYLADQMYTGLCNILGWEAVLDYPWKRIYHDSAVKPMHLLQTPGHDFGEEDVLALIREKSIDLVVLSSPRPGWMDSLESLRKKAKLPPVVLLDGEDDAHIRRELYRRSGSRLYFKREYRWHPEAGLRGRIERWREFKGDRELFRRTHPLPFSVVLDALPQARAEERDIDISYVGRISDPKRIRAVKLLKAAKDIRFEGSLYAEATDRRSKLTSGFSRILVKLQGDPYLERTEQGRKLSSVEYASLLYRSRMGLSIRGGGFDTLRYWEIVATKTLLLSEQPDIEIPNNFVHGQHALFCKTDLSDLVSLVRAHAKEERLCAEIAQRGYEHLLRYHTCERRAEYFLEKCRQHI